MARTDTRPLKSDRWAAVRAFVAHRAGLRCEHCFTFLGLTEQADHVVPRAHCEDVGIGVYDPSNLQYLCTSCHSAKTNRERWAGHEKRDRKPKRSRVKGRDDFLNAAGIPENPKEHSC